MKRSWNRRLAVFAAAALVVSACGGDDDSADEPTDEATADEPADEPTDEPADDTADDEPADDEPAEEPADDEPADDEPADEPASGEPIKIGVLTSFSGPFTPWGLQARDGMALAVEEINAAGGVDGRPLELVEVDDENDGDQAVSGFERLVEEGVIGIGGPISSTVGLATSPLAEELSVPTFLVKAGAAEILTQDSRFVFRTCIPAAPMVSAPIAQYAVAEGLTKVGAIIADYGWGQSIKAALEADFDALDGIELQAEVAPVGETDFTTYLRNLEAFGPEVIVATGHPPGSGPITVQSADLGLELPITGAYSPWVAVANGAGDAAFSRYSDFDCADFQSDDYQDLARRFLASSDLTFMDDDAVAGFGIVTMLADAVAAVGDDPSAIGEYLHGQTYDLPGYAFTMGWTEWGELAQAQPLFSLFGEGPAPEGVNEEGDWYPETLLLPEPLEPYVPAE